MCSRSSYTQSRPFSREIRSLPMICVERPFLRSVFSVCCKKGVLVACFLVFQAGIAVFRKRYRSL
jgi:hypothetical protein